VFSLFDTRRFGAFLARCRKEADLTQSELADKLDLTRQAVSKYETGESFPDVSILVGIAAVFDISLDELIGAGNPGIDDVIRLAPALKPSVLGKLTERLSTLGIDISHIAGLVQYLRDADLSPLLQSAGCSGLDQKLLTKLLPFFDSDAKEILLNKTIEGEWDWRLLLGSFPYLESLTEQIEAAVMDGALPGEVLTAMHDYFMRQ